MDGAGKTRRLSSDVRASPAPEASLGLAIKPQLLSDNHPTPIIEEIGARLDVDVAACWRPTASTYWGRVNKGHAVSMARKLVGDDYAEERSRERKGDIAAAMERAFAENAAETEGFDAVVASKTAGFLMVWHSRVPMIWWRRPVRQVRQTLMKRKMTVKQTQMLKILRQMRCQLS